MMRVRTTIVGAIAVMLVYGREARAQDEAAEASRRSLIRDAEGARGRGEHALAVELMTRAGQVRMSPSLRLFLAEEHAELLNWLQVYLNATQCRSEAAADLALRHRRSVIERCTRLEERSVPRVSFIVLRAPPGVPGLTVRVTDVEVPSALWGVRYPVAAAPATIEASTPDGRTFRSEVTMTEGGTREVPITLSAPPPPPVARVEAPLPVVVAPPVARVEAPRPVVVTLPRHRPPPPPPTGGPGAAPWILMGAGAVVLGSSALFVALRADALEEQSSACHDDLMICESSAVDANDRAGTMTLLTNVAVGVGAAAIVGGVLWRLLARPSREPATRQAWQIHVAPRDQGLTLGLAGSL